MADVFISYHEKSAGELVAQIADALESVGISCWYAKRDIPSGGDFARYIPLQIDACKVFLLILNENAQNSRHIESELGLAFGRFNRKEQITILPFEIGDFKRESWIRYYLIHVQSVKFQSVEALVKKVGGILNIPGEIMPFSLSSQDVQVAKTVQRQMPPGKTIQSGNCGDNVAYVLSENGLLTIFGTGAMWSYDWNRKTGTANTPWWDIRAKISHVVIQSGVTSVAKYAFCNCINLNAVEMPDSITKIEVGAFDNCICLTNVIIPSHVMKIETGTFNGCVNLSDIQISDKVTKIEFGAFKDCKYLTNIIIPDSVTEIELGAFAGCTSLNIASVAAKTNVNSFSFPENVAVIRRKPAQPLANNKSGECGDNVTYTLVDGILTVSGAGLMRNYNFDEKTFSCNTPWWNVRKSISSVRIQDGVTSVGAFAFNSCANLSRVEIPDSITEICAEAFYRCGSLREVWIPDSVRFIRKFAFDESGLTEISIPKYAKTGWRTFPKGARVIRRA